MSNPKKIVIVNQAVNYLTIGLANEFIDKNWDVGLVTGSVHSQGEHLSGQVQVSLINKYSEQSLKVKLFNWLVAMIRSFYLLIGRYRGYDILYISNPPMIYWLSLCLRRKFSVMVWDVYPDTLQIFNIHQKNWIYQIWKRVNKNVFKRAESIFTIGTKISESLEQYVDHSKISIVPLWSTFRNDDLIPDRDNSFIAENNLSDKFVVQYSGNIGLTHDIEVIFDIAKELRDDPKILFQIIGRGYRSIGIQKRIESASFNNVQFLEFQSDDRFASSLSAADLGIVVLDSRTAKGSVPSKTYNLMAFGKPILYIAARDSELFDYAHNYRNGRCYDRNEVVAIASFIRELSTNAVYCDKLARNSRDASNHFQRKNAAILVDQIGRE